MNATRDDFARALAGSRSSRAARATVAAARALTAMIDAAGASERIDIADVRHAHTELMRDDPGEQEYAGRLRDRPNWIGGSNDSARNAIYVPPPPELVPDLMDDLLQFANRDGEGDAFVSYPATSSVVAAQAAVQSAAELAELRTGGANSLLREAGQQRRGCWICCSLPRGGRPGRPEPDRLLVRKQQ